MTSFRPPRRALLLGLVAVAACDIYRTAVDPFPGLIQTWSLGASDETIWVDELLPTGVTILPDSSAFVVSVPGVNYSRRLGGYCPACNAVNGTTAPKPAFVISPDTGGTTNLPTDVDSAAVLGASVSYTLTNGFSFDPIRVNPSNLATGTQGWLTVTIRSGSRVLGRDSINGRTTAFPAGTSITRSMPPCSTVAAGVPCFGTGNVGGNLTVDLLLDSPAGENAFIDVSRNLTAAATVSNLQVASVKIRIPSQSIGSSTPETLEVGELPEDATKRAIAGRFEMTITNPFAVAGTFALQFNPQGQPAINKTVALPTTSTPTVRSIQLDSVEINRILTAPATTFTTSATVSATSAINVTPKQVITIANRIVLTLRAFGGE